MGRPRPYGSAAERQRAYRERETATWAQVDRRALEQMNQRLEHLREAVGRAAAAGDATAGSCRASRVETVLERLIRHFEDRAEAGQPGREGGEA
jgi:hypothetical protein